MTFWKSIYSLKLADGFNPLDFCCLSNLLNTMNINCTFFLKTFSSVNSFRIGVSCLEFGQILFFLWLLYLKNENKCVFFYDFGFFLFFLPRAGILMHCMWPCDTHYLSVCLSLSFSSTISSLPFISNFLSVSLFILCLYIPSNSITFTDRILDDFSVVFL